VIRKVVIDVRSVVCRFRLLLQRTQRD